MQKFIISLFVYLLLFSCSGKSKDEADQYGCFDGTYLAEVEYYTPNTGTSSTYTLDVEDNELVKMYWDNGGWLDDTHFTPVDISDGEAFFTSDKGYEYTVRLLDIENL
ncbi:hypothetical protein [Bergeyella zoohelcum]|uniref:Membrane-bound lysozyme-inhibitor of c-type lysozyme n=1 Tax=Bergeyella zoohelcum TaxID=1015 RepID=A0A7Z8YQ77_9FLAO|nr:hypothetical protein [Bergeyella zoohelcum]VDH05182.1 Uncharacterised protein [Bergeyella zoohelcum]